MNVYQSFIHQYKMENKIIWALEDRSPWGHRYAEGVQEERLWNTDQLERTGLWAVKNITSFLEGKGEENLGRRIGGLKEIEGPQRPTFSPLLFF